MLTSIQQGNFTHFANVLMSTLCVVAFFGFLRCAKFTCKSSFDTECSLCFNDLAMHYNHAVLKLKQSKTDRFRKGIDIRLFRTKVQCVQFNNC